ncbi:ABC transporter permease, partial [Clostridium perfringens]|uniref:ABC transporter permease n=1 Tax=Clostridium perfringens TaxID=1502 RepID=UPI002AC65E5A
IKELENTLNSFEGNRVEGKCQITDTSGIVKLLGGVLNTITMFIASVAGISLFIAGIGLMNMMYTSVSERTREIGIKRALGARKKDIRREFLIEGIVITIMGGIIGYILGIILANIISMYFKLVIT